MSSLQYEVLVFLIIILPLAYFIDRRYTHIDRHIKKVRPTSSAGTGQGNANVELVRSLSLAPLSRQNIQDRCPEQRHEDDRSQHG
jgi:hypothetical protein